MKLPRPMIDVPILALSFFVFVGSPLVAQPGNGDEFQVFAHIFHIDSVNTSGIFVQNTGQEVLEITIDFVDQGGAPLPGQAASIPVNGSVEVAVYPGGNPGPAQPFVGAALVACSGPCIATANWRLQISEAQSFNVGALPQSSGRRSRDWAAPVLPISPTSAYGFAIRNMTESSSPCTVTFRDHSGELEGEEEISLPANGQVAQFAQSVGPGFFGSTVVSCDQEVIALGLIQDQRNGFPTGINYAPLGSEASPGAPGPEDLQIFPQIFHLDTLNSSRIFVQNVGPEEIEAAIEFFAQTGEPACPPGLDCPVISQEVPPHGTVEFSRMPEPFVGSAAVFCTGPCVATADWSFRIRESQEFRVGLLPQLFSLRSATWGAPVPPLGSTSEYGFAIYNLGLSPASCEVKFYRDSGQLEGIDHVSLPANGHIARFADTVSAGFSGNALISCDQEVIATGLIQDVSNGFPTSLNYARVE